jgi:hypothetical protein
MYPLGVSGLCRRRRGVDESLSNASFDFKAMMGFLM